MKCKAKTCEENEGYGCQGHAPAHRAKVRGPRAPKVPKGYRLVTRGKVREGDLLWSRSGKKWGPPLPWNAVLVLNANGHEIGCCHDCIGARLAAKRRRKSLSVRALVEASK